MNTRYSAIRELAKSWGISEDNRPLGLILTRESDESDKILFDGMREQTYAPLRFIPGASTRSRGGQGWLRLSMRRTPRRSAAAFPPA